jgi:hypothetical protein
MRISSKSKQFLTIADNTKKSCAVKLASVLKEGDEVWSEIQLPYVDCNRYVAANCSGGGAAE